jgi:hypothetical protein
MCISFFILFEKIILFVDLTYRYSFESKTLFLINEIILILKNDGL